MIIYNADVTISVEKAAELVSALREEGRNVEAADLFEHFDNLFGFSKRDQDGGAIGAFAEKCGYLQACCVELEEV